MIGELVGSYRIAGKLGEGGMGVVWLAEHTLLGSKAAVKMLRPGPSEDKELVARFFHEAKTAATLKHPGIAAAFDFGTWKDGSAYLVMELLDGESLRGRLSRERPLPVDLASAIARQVAAALGAAHVKGIVHRDLKPDNVFLVPEADAPFGLRAKVLDFGIAKFGGEAAASDVKTRTGSVMGTPYYMSPEQCMGGSAHVDRRADVYSLGCMFFEMVCGRPPFMGDQLGAIAGAHIYKDPPAPRSLRADLPAPLDDLILRMLAKEPAARPASMDVVVAALPGPALTPLGPTPPPSLAPEVALSTTLSSAAAQALTTPRKPRGRSIAAVAVVATVAAAIGLAWFWPRPPAPVASLTPDAAPGPRRVAPSPATCEAALRQAAAAVSGDLPYAAFAFRHLARLPERPDDLAAFTAACVAKYDGEIVACFSDAKGPLDVVACAGAYERRRCDRGDEDACAATAWVLYEARSVDAALPVARQACAASSGSGCALVGVAALYGRGGPVDLAGALASLERASSLGDPTGQSFLGHVLRQGLGVAVDSPRARAILGEACAAAPDGQACAGLGDMERLGEGGALDPAAAESHLGLACDASIGVGCLRLGDLLAASKRDPAVHWERARKLLAAQADDAPSAKFRLAEMTLDGKAAARPDPLGAARLFEEACAANEWPACEALGDLEVSGKIDVDLPAARKAYEQACQGGKLARACEAAACFETLDKTCREKGYLGPVSIPSGTKLHRPPPRRPTELHRKPPDFMPME